MKNKKLLHIICALLVCVIMVQDSLAGNTVSHTFFSVRPHYQSCSPEKVSFFHDEINTLEDGYGGALQLTVFGGRSTNSDDLATFFSPFDVCALRVTEQQEDNSDIISSHFNIVTINGDFSSTISLRPRLSVFGIGFTYQQNLSRLFNNDTQSACEFWFEVSSPLTRVATTMNLKEKIQSDGGGVAQTPAGLENPFTANMQEAFNQKAWMHGRIGACKKVRWRLADIELKLGVYEKKEECSFGAHIGILIPTGNKPTAEHVFEPIVGNNKHFGLTAGGSVAFTLCSNENDEYAVQFFIDTHGRYLFGNTQKRSFDLKYKPWSRYMELYRDLEQARTADAAVDTVVSEHLSVPGINVLTKCAHVRPGFSYTINNGLLFSINSFAVEIGYNLYARQAECVRLCCWEEGPAIKDAGGAGVVSVVRTIDNNRDECDVGVVFDEDDYRRNVIKQKDIDLESASHPAALSHTLYLATKYLWNKETKPMFVSIGGSYEFGRCDAVLSRWLLWFKYGFTF